MKHKVLNNLKQIRLHLYYYKFKIKQHSKHVSTQIQIKYTFLFLSIHTTEPYMKILTDLDCNMFNCLTCLTMVTRTNVKCTCSFQPWDFFSVPEVQLLFEHWLLLRYISTDRKVTCATQMHLLQITATGCLLQLEIHNCT